MADTTGLVSVGRIINTQGHQGDVRVWSMTDFPERFKAGLKLQTDNPKLHFLTIERTRPQKNFLVMKFVEINDMNEAEAAVNTVLMVNQDEVVPLPKDTFYIYEIVGMQVNTDTGEFLGQVKDVIQTGSNDVYVVQGEEKEYLIPALKNVICKIDREEKNIIIHPLEGLLDL